MLYYDAVSVENFKKEFKDLQYVSSVEWILRLSVKWYRLGQFILWIRKSLGKLRHRE